MIKVNEIAFTGYPVTDVARARAFYEDVLGLKPDILSEGGMSWIEYDIAGSTLAISNAWPPSGQAGPSVALEVEDFDGALATLREKGVTITLEPFESPVCHMAVIVDPDGNSLVIHKRKPGHH